MLGACLSSRAALVITLAVVATSSQLQAKSVGHPRRRSVDTVIVHSLGGPDCRDGTRFFKRIGGDAGSWAHTFATLPIVSIHYVIGRDGQVVAGIPESEAASHAIGWNQRSIGIELVNNGDGVDPFPEVQLQSLVRLILDLRTRFPQVTPDRVFRHSDVDHTRFSAASFGRGCAAFRRKLDPGDAFPWAEFKARLAGSAAPVATP